MRSEARPTATQISTDILGNSVTILKSTPNRAYVQGIYGQGSLDAAYIAGQVNSTGKARATVAFEAGLCWITKITRYA